MSKKMTHTASITNQPAWMIGGSASRLGKPPSAIRAIQIRANGQGPNARTIFRVNQLAGGVGPGTGEFRPNADGVNLTRSLTHRGNKVVGYLITTKLTKSHIVIIQTQFGSSPKYHLDYQGTKTQANLPDVLGIFVSSFSSGCNTSKQQTLPVGYSVSPSTWSLREYNDLADSFSCQKVQSSAIIWQTKYEAYAVNLLPALPP